MTEKLDRRNSIVFYLQSLAGGGAEKVMIQLAGEFQHRGLEVSFALSLNSGSLDELVDEEFVVSRFNSDRFLNYRLAQVSLFRPFFRGLVRSHNLLSLIHLIRAHGKGTTIISALSDANILLAVANTITGNRAKIVLTQHNNFSRSTSGPGLHKAFWRAALPWAFRRASGVVAVSSGVAQDLEDKGVVNRTGIKTIYNPVIPRNMFDLARDEQNVTPSGRKDFSFCVIGRLVPHKRVHDVINALSLLKTRGYRPSLAVIGGGPEEQNLRRLVDLAHLNDQVEFLGFVENPYSYIYRCTALIMASEYEGLPTVIVEALSLNKCVISSNCEFGPKELLEDGTYGHLFGVGDVTALSRLMEKSLKAKSAFPPNPILDEMTIQASAENWLRYLSKCIG